MAKHEAPAVVVVLTGCERKGKARSGLLSDKEAKAIVRSTLNDAANFAEFAEFDNSHPDLWEVKTLTRHLAAKARHAAKARARANLAAKKKAKGKKAKPAPKRKR